MQRTYLTAEAMKAIRDQSQVTFKAVEQAKADGSYIGADYGSKATRLGPKYVDSINGVVVPIAAVPVANRPNCLTVVRLALAFSATTTSSRPAVPFSRETHKTTGERRADSWFSLLSDPLLVA